MPLEWTPLMRVSALKGTNSSPEQLVALAQAEALLGEDHDRAALGRLVGERGELRGLGQLALADPVGRDELGRLAVADA